MIVLGAVIGLPAAGYIALFYKEQKNRPSTVPLVENEDGILLPNLTSRLSGKLNDQETKALLKSANKLNRKLERLSFQSKQIVDDDPTEVRSANAFRFSTREETSKFKSFSAFVSTVNNWFTCNFPKPF